MKTLPMIAIVLLAGCPATSTQPGKSPEAPGGARGAESQPGQPAAGEDSGTSVTAAGGRAKPAGPVLASAGIPCAAQPCIYHGGANAYHECLNGGNGTCFHYGRTCEPAHQCMYDATRATYRTCTQAALGQCQQFGAVCEPPSRCMYNPSDHRHYVCEQIAAGTCRRFGALCDPT